MNWRRVSSFQIMKDKRSGLSVGNVGSGVAISAGPSLNIK